MQKLTGFGMKDCLLFPGLGCKHFNRLTEEDDEPLNTYDDKYMRDFEQQSFKGGKVCAHNQYYYSKSFDKILKCLAEEFNSDFESSSTYIITETKINYKDQEKKDF